MCASIHIWLPADLILCLAPKRTRIWPLELFPIKSWLSSTKIKMQRRIHKQSGIISTTINTTMSIIFELLWEVAKIVGLWQEIVMKLLLQLPGSWRQFKPSSLSSGLLVIVGFIIIGLALHCFLIMYRLILQDQFCQLVRMAVSLPFVTDWKSR